MYEGDAATGVEGVVAVSANKQRGGSWRERVGEKVQPQGRRKNLGMILQRSDNKSKYTCRKRQI